MENHGKDEAGNGNSGAEVFYDAKDGKCCGNGNSESNENNEIENNGDEGDALGRPGGRPGEVYASMPVPKYASHYKMDHQKRGLALIFNHEAFECGGLKSRSGTNEDCTNLTDTLKALGFDVQVFKDLNYMDLESNVRQVAAMDHTDHDCLLLAVLSHGELGIIYAKDTPYKPDNLWSLFTADRCPTLAGKPKMFFLQACQGDKLDGGVNLLKTSRTETDGENYNTYKIPVQADFLIVYSTVKGYYSWRNTTKGSWFIQALCEELRRRAMEQDLMTILTFVSQRVAMDFESNVPDSTTMHRQKQIPCIMSMLTRLIRFTVARVHVQLISPFVFKSELYNMAYSNDTRDVVGNTQFVDFVERHEMENNGDEADSTRTTPGCRPAEVYGNTTVHKYASHYKMDHKKRGLALIFNHKEFDWLKPREGTNADCENLKIVLKNLGFEVKDFTDLSYTKLIYEVRLVAAMDHTHHDCVLLVVLSHGDVDAIYAKDTCYKPDILWSFFTADKCPTLAGKPKMFFFSACQGDKLDGGINLRKTSRTETDGHIFDTHKIPVQADFLIVYATAKGYFAWRDITRGSWFIQALCEELPRRFRNQDLVTILTFVSQRVAIDFESHDPPNPEKHGQKQIPCILSMLTRLIRFTDPCDEEEPKGILGGWTRWMFGGQSKT